MNQNNEQTSALDTTASNTATASDATIDLKQVVLQVGGMDISDFGDDGAIKIPASPPADESAVVADGPPRFVPVVAGVLRVLLFMEPGGSARFSLDRAVESTPNPSDDARAAIQNMEQNLSMTLEMARGLVTAQLTSNASVEAWLAEGISRRMEIMGGCGYGERDVRDMVALRDALDEELQSIRRDEDGQLVPAPLSLVDISDLRVIEGASAASEIVDDDEAADA